MSTEIIRNTKKGKLVKHTYTKGIDIGDYFYVCTFADGLVEKISNRNINRVNELIKQL